SPSARAGMAATTFARSVRSSGRDWATAACCNRASAVTPRESLPRTRMISSESRDIGMPVLGNLHVCGDAALGPCIGILWEKEWVLLGTMHFLNGEVLGKMRGVANGVNPGNKLSRPTELQKGEPGRRLPCARAFGDWVKRQRCGAAW